MPTGKPAERAVVVAVMLLLVGANYSIAEEQSTGDARSAQPRIDPDGIKGSLVICGGGKLPDEIMDRFVETAGGKEARIVVIPTASSRVDDALTARLVKSWQDRGVASVAVLHSRDEDIIGRDDFVKPLTEATGVWFGGGSQSRIADAYLNTPVERELAALLQRDGVIGGTSAGAAIMSQVMIARGNPQAEVRTGFDLLPGTVIDQHFLARNRKPRLQGVLAKRKGLVGVGIDEGTALFVSGRRMRVVGGSKVTVLLAASKSRPEREIVLEADDRADLTALRRAALARALPPFPPEQPSAPVVANGSLVIVGGGGVPDAVAETFIELAGGPEALIVVLPTASPDAAARRARVPRFFTEAGAKNVRLLPARTSDEVNAPAFAQTLKRAGGVWFGGGRQWRFVDAYAGTPAVKLFRDVLKRGGVIGGSSAGASIQAEYLVRGHPLGNRVMMAEGYERGFAFLPGVAVDQHFSQRRRFADMTAVMQTFPQLLGIGVDEATALIVQGHTARIIGRNAVHFYDYSNGQPNGDGERDYQTVPTGSRYDLKARKPLEDAD